MDKIVENFRDTKCIEKKEKRKKKKEKKEKREEKRIGREKKNEDIIFVENLSSLTNVKH